MNIFKIIKKQSKIMASWKYFTRDLDKNAYHFTIKYKGRKRKFSFCKPGLDCDITRINDIKKLFQYFLENFPDSEMFDE